MYIAREVYVADSVIDIAEYVIQRLHMKNAVAILQMPVQSRH